MARQQIQIGGVWVDVTPAELVRIQRELSRKPSAEPAPSGERLSFHSTTTAAPSIDMSGICREISKGHDRLVEAIQDIRFPEFPDAHPVTGFSIVKGSIERDWRGYIDTLQVKVERD